MSDDLWFEQLAREILEETDDRAPARVKSRIYSALVSRMAESGPLLDLGTTKKEGGHLCVFENALTMLPGSTHLESMNPCRICHARALGEKMQHAPIFWPGCPYSEFHNG